MNTSTARKIAFVWVGILVFFLVISQVLHYFHTGKIIITTNSPYNTITLTSVVGGGDDGGSYDYGTGNTKTFTGHNKLVVNTGLGHYIASVQANSISSTQLIDLTSHKTLTYTINPITTTGVEPVTTQGAQDIAADSTHLLYIDFSSNKLYQIDAQNNVTAIDPSQTFLSIKWATIAYGVGEDSNGHFYAITGGSVTPLVTPAQYTNAVATDYAVAPDGQLYIAYGDTVYSAKPGSALQKIYSGQATSVSLVASNTQVAVINSPVDGPSSSKEDPDITLVSTSGKVIKKDFDADLGVWSPSGTYLVISEGDPGSVGQIVNTSLHPVAVLPTSGVTAVTWLNDNTLFYSVKDQLWAYSLQSQKSELIANMPLGDSIRELALSSDKSYIYLTTVDTNSAIAIRRVGLQGQKVPSVIYQLQDILPQNLATYSLGLVNFTDTSPVVTVQPYLSATTSPQNDVQSAAATLQSDGFDTSKLTLQLGPAVGGD